MTEKIVNSDVRYAVPAIAFVASLIAAPLLVTALTFWAIVPIYALIIGGPLFVVIGGPVLWVYLRHFEPRYLPIMLIAVAVQMPTAAILGLFAVIVGENNLAQSFPMLVPIACLFAALWSATFTALYRGATLTR